MIGPSFERRFPTLSWRVCRRCKFSKPTLSWRVHVEVLFSKYVTGARVIAVRFGARAASPTRSRASHTGLVAAVAPPNKCRRHSSSSTRSALASSRSSSCSWYGLTYMADAMEIMLISYLTVVLQTAWSLDTVAQATLASTVFAGELVGAFAWGMFGDYFGRRWSFFYRA